MVIMVTAAQTAVAQRGQETRWNVRLEIGSVGAALILAGGANAPKGPTHIKNPKRALENGAFWGLLGPFDPVFLA